MSNAFAPHLDEHGMPFRPVLGGESCAPLSPVGSFGVKRRATLVATASVCVFALIHGAPDCELLEWPCSLQALQDLLDRLYVLERHARQELLQNPAPGLLHSYHALAMPARARVWLLEDSVCQILAPQWRPNMDAKTFETFELLAPVFKALHDIVPPHEVLLDRPTAESARLLALSLLELEAVGTTHGRCLFRTSQNHVINRSPGRRSAPGQSNSGVTK